MVWLQLVCRLMVALIVLLDLLRHLVLLHFRILVRILLDFLLLLLDFLLLLLHY